MNPCALWQNDVSMRGLWQRTSVRVRKGNVKVYLFIRPYVVPPRTSEIRIPSSPVFMKFEDAVFKIALLMDMVDVPSPYSENIFCVQISEGTMSFRQFKKIMYEWWRMYRIRNHIRIWLLFACLLTHFRWYRILPLVSDAILSHGALRTGDTHGQAWQRINISPAWETVETLRDGVQRPSKVDLNNCMMWYGKFWHQNCRVITNQNINIITKTHSSMTMRWIRKMITKSGNWLSHDAFIGPKLKRQLSGAFNSSPFCQKGRLKGNGMGPFGNKQFIGQNAHFLYWLQVEVRWRHLQPA